MLEQVELIKYLGWGMVEGKACRCGDLYLPRTDVGFKVQADFCELHCDTRSMHEFNPGEYSKRCVFASLSIPKSCVITYDRSFNAHDITNLTTSYYQHHNPKLCSPLPKTGPSCFPRCCTATSPMLINPELRAISRYRPG